ncbi:DUF4920 domain-containing protein [candidate division KSB1 bacterium]|nr:DUF4920 domain-containing protein [candidate division KSB1 bacterium]
MKRIIFSISILLFGVNLLLAQAPASNEWTNYGKEMTATKTVAVNEALKEIPKDGKTVAVEGVISDVCQSKGCWLMMTDGKQQLRVQFEGYSFFVPWEVKGKKIKAQGVVKLKTIDEKTAQHWAEEQSNPEVKPKDIKGEQSIYMMTASGVAVEGGDVISKEQQDAIDGKKKKDEL